LFHHFTEPPFLGVPPFISEPPSLRRDITKTAIQKIVNIKPAAKSVTATILNEKSPSSGLDPD
jgi:uncharacterized protein YbbK (DUF523 family)